MKRKLPALNLPGSPLVYVVGQLRFSSIESMPKYIPEIQDQLRRKGFPRFLQGKIQQVRINQIPLAATSHTPVPFDITHVDRWEFQNPSKTVGVVIIKDSVALQMSRYTSFEQFCAQFEIGLEVLHQVASLALIERVGLRYVDLVVPTETESFEHYFRERLLGPERSPLEVDDSLYSMDFRGKTSTGALAIKLWQNDVGMMLPPDLNPSTLTHKLPALSVGQKVSLLDIDHSIEFADKEKLFSVDSVIDLLERLHHNADLAFRYSVREEALNKWKEATAPNPA